VTVAEQIALLRRQIAWAAEKTAFYREAFASAGVCADDVRTAADMNRLPLLERTALEGASAPFFMLALPLSGLLRTSLLRDAGHAQGIFHCYTQGDVARRVQSAARMLAAAGVNRASTALLVGDFTDGRILDLQYASDTIGAMTVPVGEGAAAADIERILHAVVPDTVVIWEDALPVIAPALRTQKIEPHRIITIGARIVPSEETRAICEKITRGHAHLYTDAALGVLIGAAMPADAGIFLDERHFFAEVLDHAGIGHTEDGAAGELVLSMTTAEAIPVLRYRTGISARLARRGTSALYIMEG
jgi:anaerobic phenylacetate coA ligase